MILLDDRTARWARNLIRAGREHGPLPTYGDDTWWTFAAGHPQRLAAIIAAAEAHRHHRHPDVVAEELGQQRVDEDEALWRRIRGASYDVAAGADWAAEARRPSYAELADRRGEHDRAERARDRLRGIA